MFIFCCMRSLRFVLPMGFIVIFLSGCGVRQYRRVPLLEVSKNDAHWSGEKDGVCVRLRVVGNCEIAKLFNGRNLAKRKKVRAFLLTVDNARSAAIELDQEHVNLQLLSVQQAYELLACHLNGASGIQAGVGFTMGLVALFTAPVGVLLFFGSFAYPPLFILSGPWVACAIGAPILIVNSNYMSEDAEQFNRELLADLGKKMRMPMVIEPSRSKTCILFTDQSRERFMMTIQEQKSGRVVPFVVDLSADGVQPCV